MEFEEVVTAVPHASPILFSVVLAVVEDRSDADLRATELACMWEPAAALVLLTSGAALGAAVAARRWSLPLPPVLAALPRPTVPLSARRYVGPRG